MKKIITLLCLLLLVGCGNKGSLSNPMKEHSSLNEINEITHGNIHKPAVPGVTDEKFYTIESEEGTIAQYSFSLNDINYTVRFSDLILDKDISGVYINGTEAFPDKNSTEAKGEGLLLARWFTTDGQYVLSAEDSVDESVFNAAVDEITYLSVNRDY